MKKTQRTKPEKPGDGLRAEYEFDYTKSRPNRFARRVGENCTVVLLDSDVSKVFSSSKSVNAALRAFITGMPKRPR